MMEGPIALLRIFRHFPPAKMHHYILATISIEVAKSQTMGVFMGRSAFYITDDEFFPFGVTLLFGSAQPDDFLAYGIIAYEIQTTITIYIGHQRIFITKMRVDNLFIPMLGIIFTWVFIPRHRFAWNINSNDIHPPILVRVKGII